MSESQRVRYMRLLVFFDLPIETAAQKKAYRLFRKFLIQDGYLMPPDGLVQVLRVTEKQFATMEFISGNRAAYDEVDTMEEFMVL